jgi:hypothetical protein
MSKSSNEKIGTYILTFYVFTNFFHEKAICFMLCVKKIKFSAKIALLHQTIFSFYTRHKKYRFSAKLSACTNNIEMYMLNFCSEFLMFSKCFCSGGRICSYVPNWIFHSFCSCVSVLFTAEQCVPSKLD